MNLSQAGRPIAVTSPLGDDVLVPSAVRWQERLGQPFVGVLSLVSLKHDIDPLDLLGQPMSVRIGDAGDSPCHLHGYVDEVSQVDGNQELCRYSVSLVPWIGLLRHVGGSRIFQQQTVVDIAKTVVDARGFTAELEDRLTQTYRQRAYCVQYDESDFDFLSRLFEEEGIYYYFLYSQDQHTLVLCDDVSAHQPADSLATLPYHGEITETSEPCVSNWSSHRRFATASCVLRDYDFQKPKAELTVRQNAAETPSTWQWYQFPGRYFEADDGQYYARVRTEAVSANEQTASVDVGTHGLQAGNLLTIESHPRDELNQEYLIVGNQFTASCTDVASMGSGPGGFECSAGLQLQPSSLPFRAPLATVKPAMPGPQVATVVGPSGEEIWTDSFGRIKVQFAWDLDGKGDDTSSCWIRVTQPWTGKAWGAIAIPRIGEEVIVQFLDGDVDRPIVIGRVYNADRMPPEALADGQAKTVLRTRSTKAGDVECFHELSFDDTKDAEKIYLHSERDFIRVVENSDSLKVGFEKQDAGDQTVEIYNDQTLSVGVGSGEGSQTIQIGQDRTTTINAGNDTLTIKQGDLSVAAAAGGVTIEAQTTLTLKCGDSTIELTPSGITIKAGGQVQIQGGLVKIN